MAIIKASIITIGDELLIGQTIDTNSAWIAQKLNALGIHVVRRTAVGDEAAEIKAALDAELARVPIVLVTGGLGPTSDDITKPLLCEYFGGTMIRDAQVLEHVKSLFEKRKRPFLEINMKQAEVPDNCKVLHNRMGTAPGMLFEKDGHYLIAMPGVPFEMMTIMQEEVIPFIRKHFISDAYVHRTILTSGEGESFIADKIKDIEAVLPTHIKLAYLPGMGAVKLRLSGSSSDEQGLIKELGLWQQRITDRLGNIVISLEDLPLEYILGQSLLAEKATISFAESCTGGNIGHLITQITGSGNYFMGSAVCYQNEIKESILGVKKETIDTYTAVSQQTAEEMVKGALHLYGSDYALSVTGKLSEGGVDEAIPVGVVWMAVANKERVVSKEFHFHYDRLRNKELAVQMALLMAWKFINGKI
jgi:nicotinamide-nucleotide amidase